MKKENCFICGQKGHWENKCPKRKRKPMLVELFDDTLDQGTKQPASSFLGKFTGPKVYIKVMFCPP